MANLTISGDTSGSATLSAPAVAGTPTLTLPTTTGTLALTSQLYGNSTVTSTAANVTLTASSNRVQSIATTAADLSVTLPDATTMELGGPLFTITNSGTYPFYLKTNGGYSIAVVYAGETYDLSLISKSTVNGLWFDTTRGPAKFGYITQAAPNITYSTITFEPGSYEVIQAAALSSNSVVIAYSSSAANSNLIVATWSGTSWSYGTPVTFSTTGGGQVFALVTLTSTTGFVSTNEGTTEPFYPFSISGTTITMGTKSADANADNAKRIQRLSNTTAIYTAEKNQLRVVYYNGASAPVLGTAVTMTSYTKSINFWMVDGTNGRSTGTSDAQFLANTFSVSNITITSNASSSIASPQEDADAQTYCYAPSTTELFTQAIAYQDPNLTLSQFYAISAVYNVSGATLTGNKQVNAAGYFTMDSTIGIPVMGSTTSGLYSQAVAAATSLGPTDVTSGALISDFYSLVPKTYQPGSGFATSGMIYRDNNYSTWWVANLSSTRYLIVSSNGQYSTNINQTLQSRANTLSNGTSWYLTIADELS